MEEKANETAAEVTPKQGKKWKKLLLWAVFILANVGAVLFALLSDIPKAGGEAAETAAKILSENWHYLLLALAGVAGYFLFRTLTHLVMMRFLTGKSRFGLCLSVTVLGKYYDYITPLATGGQPFQIYYLRKKDIPEGAAISLPLAEYTISRFAFVVLSLAAIILNAANVFGTGAMITGLMLAATIVGIVLNCAFPALIIVFLFSRTFCSKLIKFVVGVLKVLRLTKKPDKLYDRIMSSLEKTIQSVRAVAKRKRIIYCFAFALLSHLAMCSIAYFCLKAFGYEGGAWFGEWAYVVIMCLFVYNSVTFIPTPGTSGAADLSFYWLFGAALAAGTGAFAMLTWRFISYYLFIAFGLVQMLIIAVRKKRAGEQQV